MFSEWTVPTDDGVHVFWSTQSGAGPADLDSCPSSHHPALPVILILVLGHYIFHHPPFHLPLRHLYPLVDLWPSHSTPQPLHYTSPPVSSNQWLSSLQHPSNVFVLTFKVAENPSYSLWSMQLEQWPQISAKTKFTTTPLKNCRLSSD